MEGKGGVGQPTATRVACDTSGDLAESWGVSMHALGNPVPWIWVSVYSGPDASSGLALKGWVCGRFIGVGDRHGAVDSASFPEGF